MAVPANGYVPLLFDAATPAEWLRVKVDRNCTATAFLHLSSPRAPTPQQAAIFCQPRAAGAGVGVDWRTAAPGRLLACAAVPGAAVR